MSLSDAENPQGENREAGKVMLRREPVELYKILKFEGFAGSGAEAKLLIDAGRVRVNGDVETRRRRKIVDKDLIDVDGSLLQIIVAESGSLS